MSHPGAQFRLPQRMREVQTPVIPLVADWIRRHPGTVSLGQGVVSYGPPAQAYARIRDFQADPENHKYKAVAGLPDLIEALEAKVATENRIQMGNSRSVIVTAGSNMGFMNAVLALTDPGDEVVLQTPYYFNHEMAIGMAGCRAVLVDTDREFQPRPDALQKVITDKTRAVVTISPNNPTGAVYQESVLRQINELCQERGIYHIHDEAYEYFTYDSTKHFSPGSLRREEDRTISLFSLSKAYGFASWRIGYMVVPRHLVESIRKIQDTILICPPVVSQYAALGAVEAGRGYCRAQMETIRDVRRIVLERLGEIEGICEVPKAEGAFYFFLRLRESSDPLELTRRLIERHGVAVMPGSTFGMTTFSCLRIAYGALHPETVREGMNRLIRGLRDLAGS